MGKAEELQANLEYLSLHEIAALKGLSLMLPENPVVVNVGAGAGTSSLSFLESRDDLFLYSVDIEPGVRPIGGLGNEKHSLDKSGIKYKDRYQQVPGDSIEVAMSWSHDPVDLVFIDGNHRYNYVSREIPAWLANLRDGGYIVFHDYGSPRWPEVKTAVDEADLGVPVLRTDSVVAFQVEEKRWH